MSLTMYSASVAVFARMLTNLSKVLEKAEAYATERKFDVNVLVSSRLAPDMHPLSFQVQSATDNSKFAIARLTGTTGPSWPDAETTIVELKARIAAALENLKKVTPADLNGTDTKEVVVKVRGVDTPMSGEAYLLGRAMPNFYFHVTTAYAILRHNGVPIGKGDFLG